MKEMFIDTQEELMEELHPEQEYWELTKEEQYELDDRTMNRVQDKIGDMMDEGRQRRKYGGH